MTEALVFSLAIILPNLMLMALGFFLRITQKISSDFIEQSSALVFNYCLPCLLFFSVLNSDASIGEQIQLIKAGVLATLSLFIIAELYVYFFVKSIKDKGVFVQGVFRSNMAIIGLATVHNAYGEQGLSIASVYMGLLTILFNVLAVITLSRTVNESAAKGVLSDKIKLLIKKIFTNPLVIALVTGFFYKELNFPMPASVIEKTASLLANMALPLALICAGASLNVSSMLKPSGLSMQASLVRIFLAPVIAVISGVAFALHDSNQTYMGVLFIMVSAPTAAASYVMAKSMGGNEVLAANILAFTTVFSMIAMGIGAGVLRSLKWI